jgi:flagellar basal body-associated protein FliL
MPVTDTDPGTTPGSDGKDGLGAGAITLIVIGSVLVVGIGGFAAYWFFFMRKKLPTNLPPAPENAEITPETEEIVTENGSDEEKSE